MAVAAFSHTYARSYTHTLISMHAQDAGEHTGVGSLAPAHLLIVAIVPTVCQSNRIREGEPTHLLSCGGDPERGC